MYITIFNITGRPNVTISHKTCIENHSVTLIGMVFLYEERPEIQTLFWSKNGQKLNSHDMRGKYSEVSINNPSLTIFDVNQHDAGSYQLTATNAVGSTQSNAIVLGINISFIFLASKLIMYSLEKRKKDIQYLHFLIVETTL